MVRTCSKHRFHWLKNEQTTLVICAHGEPQGNSVLVVFKCILARRMQVLINAFRKTVVKEDNDYFPARLCYFLAAVVETSVCMFKQR